MHPKQTIMSNFCLFNPEHEIALASNLMNFTAPKAGRMLRADLGFLASGIYGYGHHADCHRRVGQLP